MMRFRNEHAWYYSMADSYDGINNHKSRMIACSLRKRIMLLNFRSQTISKLHSHIQTPRQLQAPQLQLARVNFLDYRIGR